MGVSAKAASATKADTATYATNAGTASAVTWSNVKNKPTTFTAGGGSANYSTQSGTATYNTLERTSNDSQYHPGGALVQAREFCTNVANTPNANQWWHIYTNGSVDTSYATQLALAMTSTASIYYRQYEGGTWRSWNKIFPIDNVGGVSFDEASGAPSNSWIAAWDNGTIKHLTQGELNVGTATYSSNSEQIHSIYTTDGYNYAPNSQRADLREYSSTGDNRPGSSQRYHVLTTRGNSNKMTQLAMGVDKDEIYYRHSTTATYGTWNRIDQPFKLSNFTARYFEAVPNASGVIWLNISSWGIGLTARPEVVFIQMTTAQGLVAYIRDNSSSTQLCFKVYKQNGDPYDAQANTGFCIMIFNGNRE